MLNHIGFRLVTILVLAIMSGSILYSRGISLGLDLRGGTQLTLEIRDPAGALTVEQREDAIDRSVRVIRSRVDELGVAEPMIQKVGRTRILVELPGATRAGQQRAKEVLERSAFLEFQIVRALAELQDVLPRIDRAAAMAMDVEPSRATTRPISDLVLPAGAGNDGIVLVAEEDVGTIKHYLELAEVQQALPRGAEFKWGNTESGMLAGFRKLYLLDVDELITGEHLVDAQAQRDPQLGHPVVGFEFSWGGGRIFEQRTRQNVGRLMAIVLDDRVMSPAVIREAIGSHGRIELGGSTLEEARDLALVLRAGALPAPIEIVEERSVGPSLGQDSIDRGRVAGMIGLGAVVFIMLFYYRLSGVLAILALCFYVLFVLAGLASVGAALTLPGIAGLILSIGMAVDANVLIFERIREELATGQSPRLAVKKGFDNARSAIVDAQLTTMLTAFVLYQIGTGPVRGFALTLAIGIIASMFTAIYITRTFFTLYLMRSTAMGKDISI